MSENTPRVLVIGAGVNGSICASELFKAGVNVTLLARGSRYESLVNEGVVIEDPMNGKRSVTRVPVIKALTPDDVYDFILVIIRKNQWAELLPVLAANSSPNIAFLGNNLAKPDDLLKVLGNRVMLGSVFGAGRREGNLIRAITIKSVGGPIGEVDGSITPRLKQLAGILRRAGFKASLSTNMLDFQLTHATGVAVIGTLTLKYNCDLRALSKATDDLRAFIRARREGLDVLRALGHKIVPASEAFEAGMPEFIQLFAMRWLLSSRLGEVGLAWHCSQAPDEIHELAVEMLALVEQSGLPAPNIRRVLTPG